MTTDITIHIPTDPSDHRGLIQAVHTLHTLAAHNRQQLPHIDCILVADLPIPTRVQDLLAQHRYTSVHDVVQPDDLRAVGRQVGMTHSEVQSLRQIITSIMGRDI